jgi:hypothetical protein
MTSKIPNGKVMGLDEEGEVNALYRFSGQKGLWIAGGSYRQARWFSKHLVSRAILFLSP